MTHLLLRQFALTFILAASIPNWSAAQGFMSDSPPGGEYNPLANCKPALDAGSISIAPGGTYRICESNSCRMSLDRLDMGLRSGLYLPSNCGKFVLEIKHASFAGENIIESNRYGVGERGTHLTVYIERADLLFPVVSPPADPMAAARASILAQLEASNRATVARSGEESITPSTRTNGDLFGIWIKTSAGPGRRGATGADGYDPADASCSKADGPDKPTAGANGAKGGPGGQGGDLRVRINVTRASRTTITENDIRLQANGGLGGTGGDGGRGGGPVAGVRCMLFSHGGHSKEPDGQMGPQGDNGPSGSIVREIRLID